MRESGNTLSVVTVAFSPIGASTTWDTVFDVEEPKASESVGVNTALSECVPVGNIVLVDATPPQAGTAAPMLVLSSINCTQPAAGGLTVAFRVSTVTAAIAKEPGGVTSSAVIVSVRGASKVTPPSGGAALATPPSSNADPAATVITTALDSRRVKRAAGTRNRTIARTPSAQCAVHSDLSAQ
jgi:hypothetical protein